MAYKLSKHINSSGLNRLSNEKYYNQSKCAWKYHLLVNVFNLTVDFWLTSCVQDDWGVTQEETSWKETDGIQNPRTQHPLPSHCQGTSGTLLVIVTQLFLSSFCVDDWIVLWFLPSVLSVHLESWRQSVFQRKQLVQGLTEVLALLTSSPNRMQRFVCCLSFHMDLWNKCAVCGCLQSSALIIESICCTLPQHPSVWETPRAGMGWCWGNRRDAATENSWTFSWYKCNPLYLEWYGHNCTVY